MQRSEMEIIEELMEELKGAMDYTEDDFSERLGRKKPEMEIVKVEGELSPEMESEDPMLELEEMESPEDKLKSRLQKLRG